MPISLEQKMDLVRAVLDYETSNRTPGTAIAINYIPHVMFTRSPGLVATRPVVIDSSMGKFAIVDAIYKAIRGAILVLDVLSDELNDDADQPIVV